MCRVEFSCFIREQDKAQRNALQSVVKQAAIRQFRAGSDFGVTIAARSLVIADRTEMNVTTGDSGVVGAVVGREGRG
jgi:hypothetical protein